MKDHLQEIIQFWIEHRAEALSLFFLVVLIVYVYVAVLKFRDPWDDEGILLP